MQRSLGFLSTLFLQHTNLHMKSRFEIYLSDRNYITDDSYRLLHENNNARKTANLHGQPPCKTR